MEWLWTAIWSWIVDTWIRHTEQKKHIYLSKVGPTTFQILVDQLKPEPITSKTYEDLKLILNKYYSKQAYVFLERVAFTSRYKQAYYTILKRITWSGGKLWIWRRSGGNVTRKISYWYKSTNRVAGNNSQVYYKCSYFNTIDYIMYCNWNKYQLVNKSSLLCRFLKKRKRRTSVA